MTIEDIHNRIKTALDVGEPPKIAVARECDSIAKMFMSAAIAALYFSFLSVKYGTPEMIVGYWRWTAVYAGFGCAAAIIRDKLGGVEKCD